MRRQKKKKLNKLYSKILIFLLILFLPTQLGKHFFLPFSYLSGVRVDYLAPTVYLTDIIVALLFLINWKTVVSFFMKKKVLIIFGLLFLNIIFAPLKFISLYQYLKIVELLTVFVIFSQIKIGEKTVLFGFLTAGGVELILSLLQLSYKRSLQGVFYWLGERYFTESAAGAAKASLAGVEFLRPYGTFSHPNSLAGFYLLVYFFVLTDKKFNKLPFLKYFSLFIFSALVLVSFSKVAIVTFLILNTLYLILNTKAVCKICSLGRVFLLIVAGLVFLQATADPLTLEKRLELLKNASVIIHQQPIFGVGLGNYLLAQNQFTSKYFLFFNQPVHNIFLLFFAEVGLPLAIFILYQLLLVFKKRLFTIYYLLFTIFITGFFDHYWLTLEQNFLLMGVVFGLKFF
jgi:O-antigen ligase